MSHPIVTHTLGWSRTDIGKSLFICSGGILFITCGRLTVIHGGVVCRDRYVAHEMQEVALRFTDLAKLAEDLERGWVEPVESVIWV
jgi:hypothetical protein